MIGYRVNRIGCRMGRISYRKGRKIVKRAAETAGPEG
jgi:hypothetical protein